MCLPVANECWQWCRVRYGFIVDNVNVGKDLTEGYWKPGNRAQFLDLVEALTGAPLTAQAWVETLKVPVDEVLSSERVAYESALKAGPKFAAGTEVDLDMRVMLVHGDDVVADSATAGLYKACEVYKEWLKTLQ